MNILLLYPEMPDTFWSMKYLMKLIGKKSSYPPLGLLTVSNMLPTDWDKRLVDLNVSSLEKKDIEWADYVFISAMNVQEESAKKAIDFCKKFNKPIVAGGPLFTHEHEKFSEVDYFILNEAELTLPPFINDLQNGNLKRIYSTKEFADVTKTPLPNWKLVDFKNYAYAIVQYSRGCPYMCDFCDVTALFGRRPRTKTAVQIITELEQILTQGYPEIILFADDNLIGNRVDLKNNLLPALIKWRKNNKSAPGFATQVTVNLADDEEMMQQMIEAGFRHIFVGIESPNEESLEDCKKTQNLRRNLLNSISLLQNKGFIVTAGFIVGFDSDKETIFDEQINFIQESGIVIATVNLLKAPPGTDLYKRLKGENRLVDSFNFDENKTNIVTKIDEHTLYNGYKKILDNIYNPSMIYIRAKSFLDNYGNHKSENPIQRKFSFTDVFTSIKIIFYVGIIGKEKKYFWKLVINTFLHNKNNVVLSFFFGALIYQFQMLHKRFLETYSEIEHTLTKPENSKSFPTMK